MGYFDKAPGNTLRASQVDTLMLQSIMRFANAAARDSALSGVLDDGLLTYLEDTEQYTTYNGADWHVHLEMPKDWSPTISQPGSIAKTVDWGFYSRFGGMFLANCKMTITGSGTATNPITVSAPITEVVGFGSFVFYDTSLGQYRSGAVLPQDTSTYGFVIDSGADLYGVAGTDGMTNGDVIWIQTLGLLVDI